MTITILATGTTGDTVPYIALGVALQKAGHTVRFTTFENYAGLVKSHGLDFYPVKGDVAKVAGSEEVQRMKADSPLKMILSFNKLKTYVYGMQEDFFNACKGADAVVYHPGAAIGYFAAKEYNIPSILLATPVPMSPTREYPSMAFYRGNSKNKVWNLMTHKIFENVMWMASKSAVKAFWQKEFGYLPKDFASPFSKQDTKEYPTIVSCSRHVFPRSNDWPEHVHLTGYWYLDEAADWQPPADLLNFLGSGLQPVYVGFGSIGDRREAIATTELVVEALRRTGQRGIIATGWGGLAKLEKTPEDVFFLESAPHAWLFPRMAAVVHHGGAGTTAAGLRAGIPAVIIPFANDQFAWGQRVYELGAGAAPIPRKKLTVDKLVQAIGCVLQDKVKATAEQLGREIRKENGMETAAKIIIDCVDR